MYDHQSSNGLHPSAWNGDRLEPVTGFDYDLVDFNLAGVEPVEETIPWQDMTAAFSCVIDWCCQTKDIRMTAGRVHSLALLLWPESAKFSSLTAIAEACSCTKAALSKSLLEFKDAVGLPLSIGKNHHTRQVFAESQRKLVKSNRHSSQTRKIKAAEVV